MRCVHIFPLKIPLFFFDLNKNYSADFSNAEAVFKEEIAKPTKLTLYSYWMSSCSQRLRIVLHHKGLEYEYKAVNLLKDEQSNPEFVKINPLKYVPALVDGDTVVTDSFAIILYLEDMYPQHPLLPQDPKKKALNLQVASVVSSSIQPFHNFPSVDWIRSKFSSDEIIKWAQHHINKGLTALEKLLKDNAGKYATGDEVQLADVFLEPQIYVGITLFQIDMSPYPTLARLHQAYSELPAFQAALPERQPDAPSSS